MIDDKTMIIKNETVKSISKLLGFTITGNEQDWAVEFADKDRINEFISILKSATLSADEQYGMICLIIASYEDYLYCKKDVNNKIWNEITNHIDIGKHIDILNYWALWNERNSDNMFQVTPIIRVFLERKT